MTEQPPVVPGDVPRQTPDGFVAIPEYDSLGVISGVSYQPLQDAEPPVRPHAKPVRSAATSKPASGVGARIGDIVRRNKRRKKK